MSGLSPLRLCLALLVAVSLLLGTPATVFAQEDGSGLSAENKVKYEALITEGKALYKAERFTEALEKFEAAFALKKEPNLLHAMGMASERNGKIEEAVEYYDQFVVSPNLPIATRAEVQERIDVLGAIIEGKRKKEQEKQDQQNANNNTTNNNTTNNNTDTTNNGDGTVEPIEPVDTTPWGPIALTITGGALLVGGIVVLAVLPAEDDFINEATAEERRSARDSRQLQFITGITATSLGVVCTIAGISWWVASSESDEASDTQTGSVNLVPHFYPGGGGVGLHVQF